jgi:hypothetical protein
MKKVNTCFEICPEPKCKVLHQEWERRSILCRPLSTKNYSLGITVFFFFLLCPSSGQRFGNWICFCPQLGIARHLLCRLQGDNLSPWTRNHLLATYFHSGFLFVSFFDPEAGGNMLLRNVGWLSTGYTALYPRRENYCFENSVPSWQKAHSLSIKRTKALMLFSEVIPVYSDNHMIFINMHVTYEKWSGVATGYGLRAGRLKDQSSSLGSGKNFLFSRASRPALGPIKPPTQWVPELFPRGYSVRGVKLTTHLRLMPR